MEQGVYDVDARVAGDHWWFRGRRMLFAAELRKLNVGPDSKFLDVGTGMGSNLRMLRDEGYRSLAGVDLSQVAVHHCVTNGFESVLMGDVTNLPFAEGNFNVVLATDIIEHVEDDRVALREMHRVLAPGGHIVIAVPAFPSLWGLQDEVAHHKRRYKMNDLVSVVRSGGFRINRSFYFNYLLFAPIWLARQIIRVLKLKRASESEFNTATLNRFLFWIFAIDIWTAPTLQLPFGVSILLIGQKTK